MFFFSPLVFYSCRNLLLFSFGTLDSFYRFKEIFFNNNNNFGLFFFLFADTNLEPGYRSAVQENALIISLQMFNLILERCVALLKEQLENPSDLKNRLVGDDIQVLLPAVKIWCDWLLSHTNVWNPPPCCTEYKVG